MIATRGWHPAPLIQAAVAAAVAAVVMVAPIQARPADRSLDRQEVREIIVRTAETSGVPVSLALAVAKVESDFRADYEGPTGARGVMQILPATARDYGVDGEDLWDARANVRLGLRILEHLVDTADGDWEASLARFATGRSEAQVTPGRDVVRAYVAAVLDWERRYAEEIVAGSEVERRKREVLFADAGRQGDPGVLADGRYVRRGEPGFATARPAAETWLIRSRRRHEGRTVEIVALDDFSAVLEARRQAARADLDDFASGRVARLRAWIR